MRGRVCIDFNGNEYFVHFEEVDHLDNNAMGQYIPEKRKILLLKNCDVSTIYHEAIHATIDMFKSIEESFDGMFYDRFNFGEEAFCHYSCDLAKQIIFGVNK
jgi:hypothetical protein